MVDIGNLTSGLASLVGNGTGEREYTDDTFRAIPQGLPVAIRESNRTIDRRFGDEG